MPEQLKWFNKLETKKELSFVGQALHHMHEGDQEQAEDVLKDIDEAETLSFML
jgi:hypothetical protein